MDWAQFSSPSTLRRAQRPLECERFPPGRLLWRIPLRYLLSVS